MSTKDYLDHTLSGATASSVEHFEAACHQVAHPGAQVLRQRQAFGQADAAPVRQHHLEAPRQPLQYGADGGVLHATSTCDHRPKSTISVLQRAWASPRRR